MTRIDKKHPAYPIVAAELAAKFGGEPKPRDVWWGLLNRRLMAASTLGQESEVRDVSYQMAVMLSEDGKPSAPIISRLRKSDLTAFQKMGGIVGVQIYGVCDDRQCEECNALDGKKMTLEEATLTHPIPPPGCLDEDGNPGLCRCTYVPLTSMDG